MLRRSITLQIQSDHLKISDFRWSVFVDQIHRHRLGLTLTLDITQCPKVLHDTFRQCATLEFTGVVHSWKSWIICLTEVIFPEYQCDFRCRASPNYRYMSGTWMKVFGTELFPFLCIFLFAEKRPSKRRNEYMGNSQYKPTFIPVCPLVEKGLQNKETSTQVTALKKDICSHFSNFVKKAFKPRKWVPGLQRLLLTTVIFEYITCLGGT